MASFGHFAVGIAAARGKTSGQKISAQLAAIFFYSFLAFLPDIDVIGFHLHVPYRAPFGHRGALHSLAFAIFVGILIGLFQALRKRRWVSLALLASAVVATHGVLDAMTNGGLGVALFWPFTNHRYFLPWRPIPVAPIGSRMLSTNGLFVALAEVCLFAPLLAYAFWPRVQHPLLDGKSREDIMRR